MTSYINLLQILDGFIHDRMPLVNKDINYAELYKLASMHSVLGIVGYMCYKYPSLISNPWKDKFQYESCRILGYMSLKDEQMKCIEAMLEKQTISYVPFKGSVIKKYYPVPELRTYGDIDVLIHLKDRRKVHQCLIENAFICTENWEPVYSYLKSKSLIEVHTELLDTKLAACNDFLKNNMWKQTVSQTKYRKIFKDEFHFVYLMAHLAKHVKSSGAGVRMILDLALMIEKCEMDWDWISRALKETGLTLFAEYVFGFISVYFHCQIPLDYTMPEDISVFMEYIMQAGTFGKEGRDSGVSALKNSDQSKGIQIVRYVFPKVQSISARYTYLKKYPFLLPIAWIHRIIITASSTPYHLSKAISMAKADEHEIDRLKKLNENMGL